MQLSNLQLFSAINQLPSNKALQLKPGVIFLGSANKIYPNQTALINIANQNLIAKLEVPLVVNEKYWFEVVANEEEVRLRILSPLTKEKQTNSSLLNMLSLPNNHINKQILSFIAKEQIPLSKESIDKIHQWIEQLPNYKDSFNVIKFMAEKDLPFSDAIYKSLLEALKPQKPIHTLLNTLESQLHQELESNTAQKLLASIQAITAKDMNAEKIIHTLLQIASNPKNEYQETAMKFLEKMNLLNIDKTILEKTVGEKTKLPDEPKINVINPSDSSISSKVPNDFIQTGAQKIYHLINQKDSLLSENERFLLDQLAVKTNEVELPQNILSFFKSVIGKMGFSYEADILNHKENLKSFDQMLKPLLITYVHEQEHPTETKELAEQLINKMNGQQILSATSSHIQHLVYQLPLQLFGFQTELTMQWSGKRLEDGKIDPNYCHVLFYLELENLKETIVEMKVQNRVITMKIMNSSQRLQEIAKAFIPKLKDGLKQLDYTLSTIQYDTFHHDVSSSKALMKNLVYDQYSGVDFRI